MADKFVTIGAVFFFLADAFAISSVASPWWIIYKPLENREGVNLYGLIMSCRQMPNGTGQWCGSANVPKEWRVTLVFLLLGILALSIVLVLLLASFLKGKQFLGIAQKVAFAGMMFFCLAALIFPTGFWFEEIGGSAYKLTSTTNVGTSYVLFVMALFFTIIGELFTARICAPMM